jgi:hypothetical protein
MAPKAAPGLKNPESGAGQVGHFSESPVFALIVEQLFRLQVRVRSPPLGLDQRHRAIGHEQIQQAVIVVVEELGPEPREIEGCFSQATLGTYIVKKAFPVAAE